MFEESLNTMFREIDGWGPADPGIIRITASTEDEPDDSPEDDLFGVEPVDANTMRKEITMDGDRYLLSVPTKEILEAMNESDPVLNTLLDESDDLTLATLVLRREYGSLYSLVNSDNMMNRLFSWSMVNGEAEERGDTKNVKVPYRPVLIPLDKDGKVDFSMREQNPDGSVVEGGQAILTKAQGKLPFALPFAARKEELYFFDSNTNDQENLKWVWFHGIMINLCPTITIQPKTLATQGLISEAILNSRFCRG